ncbi:MAG: hypothetical protein WD030_03395, partial [Pirellulales bacterium]
APGGQPRPGLPAPPELIKVRPEPLDELENEIVPEPSEEHAPPGKPLVPEEDLPQPGEELPPPPAQQDAPAAGGVQLPFDLPFFRRGESPPQRPLPE